MKPIAKMDHYPYTVGGIRVSGAKINGTTYVDELYILQQRSDIIYDLISSSGEIFTFVPVTWKNVNGHDLDYYTDSAALVDTIKDNTFFWKVQDPSENIYGFMTLIQLNKIKVHTGKYIYRMEYQETTLQSVNLYPEYIQANVGDIIEIDIAFNPSTIENKHGNWILSNSNILRSLPEHSTSTKQCYECLYEGAAYAVFVPDANKSLTASSTVVVANPNPPEPPEPVETDFVAYLNNVPYSRNTYYNDGDYYAGETVTIKIATAPYDFVLSENLSASISVVGGVDAGVDVITQLDTTDDPNTYKFKIHDDLPYAPNGGRLAWSAKITLTGLEKTFTFKLVLSNYAAITEMPDVSGVTNYGVGYPKRLYTNGARSRYGNAWVSSDTSIITVDREGLCTPIKEGKCKITCYHANADGTPNYSGAYYSRSIQVMENIPTNVHYFPNDRFTYEVGEEVQFTYELVPAGSQLPNGPVWSTYRSTSSEYVTVSDSGLVKPISTYIYENDYFFNYNYITVLGETDYVANEWLNLNADKVGIGIVPPGTVIKPTHFESSLGTQTDYNELYTVIPLGKDPVHISMALYPVLTTGDKSATIEVDDPSIVSLSYDQVSMNSSPSFFVTLVALKKGSTIMTVTSNQDPSIKHTRRIYIA